MRIAMMTSTLLAAPLIMGNTLPSWTVDEQIKAAKVAVIATPVEIEVQYRDDYPKFRGARFRLDGVLKGKSPGPEFIVPYRFSSAELSFDCCVIGERYLLLLTYAGPGKVYISANGKNSVYRISSVNGWTPPPASK